MHAGRVLGGGRGMKSDQEQARRLFYETLRIGKLSFFLLPGVFARGT
jgi:hypothetical protein